MNYTFDEKEIQCFLDWSFPAALELGLDDFEKELQKKLSKILNKSFNEMTNDEKIYDFMIKCGYPMAMDDKFYYLRKEGKEEKCIPYEMDYKEAVKEIVNYFED